MSVIAELVWVNNVLYDRSQQFSSLHNREGISTLNSFVGNVYIEGDSVFDWADGSEPISLTNEFTEPASRLFLEDNSWSDLPTLTDQWDMVNNDSGQSLSVVKAESAPTWAEGLVAKPNSETLDWVLAQAGARPADRDSVELRIVKDVVDGTGEVINCVEDDGSERCSKNAGGWPEYAVNTQAFDAPDDPSGDDDDDGYTNLEEKLHEMANAVEGNAGSGGSSSGGNGGSSGASSGGASSGGNGAGSSSGGTSNGGASGGNPASPGGASEDSGGCSLPSGHSPSGASALLAALALLAFRRRRD
jgi:hypothetical protein